ncbi:Sulfur carrier protein ThiS [Campylobacter sputorum subsp. bubulus]|uniref:Sulfur carrier protein ThiS n=1 Tax=Campylobacter sputorum subsp. sputorum TaxID=32024 RepID=A0A381DKX0_9BACT|nr:sulfur carrier protein ThiS [Campylobacter sputorum]ASM34675.1 thiamin biosynthesis protein [Campylobacter sputorum aubsp. sputorum RM3237]KAB0581763.1 sulfur carrier protein ThiS [Campylobacter sputorum subsp. sputorum]QEL04866.1 thiamine biosynthesis protein [Campylobacter sputorum subsp. sputorum]SUX09898.1 Sulfur carrier protein ThiS [Campylobacter sputorum subsp. bubulus]SUX11352.1 Sulfur carrier protein ThiS [Campylobacter sputorum subsp. sputorum]
MLSINGILSSEFINFSIEKMLKQKNYDIKHIAVELNGEILPKSKFQTTILKDGDKVEIVSFVRGG